MKQIYAIFLTLTFTGLVRANEPVTSKNNTTDNDLTVFANDLSPLLGHLRVNGNDYTTLKATTGAEGNHFEFDMDNGLRVKAWLITSDSAALPYTAVTRKEYLDQARQELEHLRNVVATYKQTIRLIDSIRRNSTPQQLARAAVVSVKAQEFRGFEDGQANTTMLVRMNPAYFTGSNDQAPKCLLVCWRYNPAESIANGSDNQLATALQKTGSIPPQD